MKNITSEITKISQCKLKIKVTIDRQTIENLYNESCLEIQKNLQIPGFRKGCVPVEIIKKYFPDEIKQKLLDKTIQKTLPNVLEENKIKFIANSIKIEKIDLKENETSYYEVTLETEPTVKLKSYKGLKLKKEIRKTTQKDLDTALNQIKENYAKLVPSQKTKIQQEDISPTSNIFCIVNYKIFVDKKELKKYEGKNVLINLSSDSLPLGLKEGMVDMNVGEKKIIQIEFPPNIPQLELMGKKAEIEVELLEIKEKKLPVIDNDFAKSIGYKSLDELISTIKENIQKELDKETEQKIKEQIYEILLKEHNIAVPETEVKKHYNEILEEIKEDFLRKGGKEENFKLTQEQQNLLQKKAEDEVKLKYILKAIIEQEKIELTKEEIEKEKGKLLALYPTRETEINEYFEKNLDYFASKLLEEKILNLIISHAKIKEVDITPK
ncbi:MAG: trigger factor [Elusimicrobiota bacterium]|nr:trigger factor [Endomicrobiia bacterium]MDW8166140.1 trigger factor [Elusimicrobiota bacterium]